MGVVNALVARDGRLAIDLQTDCGETALIRACSRCRQLAPLPPLLPLLLLLLLLLCPLGGIHVRQLPVSLQSRAMTAVAKLSAVCLHVLQGGAGTDRAAAAAGGGISVASRCSRPPGAARRC